MSVTLAANHHAQSKWICIVHEYLYQKQI